MSDKKTNPALAFVAKLRERARRGDKLAIAELQKLKAIGAQYKQLAMQTAAESAAEEVVDGDEAETEGEDVEVLGDSDDEAFAGDKLEQADWISRKYENADGLVKKVKLRDQGWKGLADVAKFVRINPPSVMQGVIGNYQIVNSDDIGPVQVVNWGGEDEETLPVTITVAPVQQLVNSNAFLAGLAGASPYAVVKWGTRAALSEATIDIAKGVQLTVNASYCTVSVGVQSTNASGVVTTIRTTMKLMGMLSFYPCVRTNPITRTAFFAFDGGGGGTSPTVDVPNFARNVIVLPLQAGAPPVAQDYEIIFVDSAGNGIYTRTVRDATSGPMLLPYPLSDDIVGIKINTTGTFIARIVFELAI